MPRQPPETRVRRLLMQSVMWIILGAAVGLAALVDHAKQRGREVSLGAPTALDGGKMNIKLPEGWQPVSDDVEGDHLVLQRSPGQDADTVEVKIAKITPRSLFGLLSGGGGASGGAHSGAGVAEPGSTTTPFGDADGLLVVRKFSVTSEDPNDPPQPGEPYLLQLTVSRPLPDGRIITLTSDSVVYGDRAEFNRRVRLVKEMAASLKLM